MRKWIVFFATLSLVLGTAGAATAAPLNWSGTSTVLLADLGIIPLTGGGVATVNNSNGVVPAHLETLRLKASRGNVTGTATIFITDPDTLGNGITKVVVEAQLGTGTFAPISGAVANSSLDLTQNILPVEGLAKIFLLGGGPPLSLPLVQPRTVNGVTTKIEGVGVGGLIFVGNKSIKISVQANPWTIKTAAVQDQILTTGKANTTYITLTGKGFAHGPASNTTTTAQASGVVQVVTPAQITTNLTFGTALQLGVIVTYTIHFIPEPGLLLLLVSGVAGLLVIGRTKLRK